MQVLLLFSIFAISACGMVYELISSTLASYLLGDSITQFSTIIGVYLFAMGVGAYLCQHLQKNLTGIFVQVELLIGLVGGFSSTILFLLFEQVSSFRVLVYSLIGLVGCLVGLELPLLMRILKTHFEFKKLVSKVFTFDYVGALLGSLLFPLVLVPHLGLVRSSFLFGVMNVLVAIWALNLFKQSIPWVKPLKAQAFFYLLVLLFGFVYSDQITRFTEALSYPDRVIYSKSSPYQRIVLTQEGEDLRLFLNGNLQFSSRDEYRYHEALVHPGLSALQNPKRVLVLGGGDGLALREILKYRSVETIQLVDLDHRVVDLFSNQDSLKALNGDSFHNPKVHLAVADAFEWLKTNKDPFDFVVVDFPDPSNFSIGKLYSTTFFNLLHKNVKPEGAVVIQSTSPYVARKSFWCVAQTLDSVDFWTRPYHLYVPSFGEWGFVLASWKPLPLPEKFPEGLKFLNAVTLRNMVNFPPDMAMVKTGVNRLDNQVLVRYFENEWSKFLHY